MSDETYAAIPVGFCIFHTVNGQQVVLNKKDDGLLYSVNLDGLDDPGYEAVVNPGDRSNYTMIEPITERRFHWLREMAHRKARIHDYQMAFQLMGAEEQAKQHQAAQQARQQNVRMDQDEAEVYRRQVEQENLEQPVPASNGEAMEGDYQDGAVIEIPRPGA